MSDLHRLPISPFKYPELGDANKKYLVEFTEPELNTIAAMIGYAVNGIRISKMQAEQMHVAFPPLLTLWLEHYGPTAEQVGEKIKAIEEQEKGQIQ